MTSVGSGESLESPGPGLAGESETGEPRAGTSKDRECPFCHVSFTSSSYGRHLDLYIKDRNPKHPDGVHDVHQIRQMRGKITRRQAKGVPQDSRGSPSKQTTNSGHTRAKARPKPLKSGESRSQQQYPQPGSRIPALPSYLSSPGWPQNGHVSNAFPRVNWHATGVINDIPPRSDAPVAGHVDEPSDQGQRERPPWERSAISTASQSAAEVALRDVLHKIQRASTRLQRPEPFDFDVFVLNFPSLCLKLLAVPSTLFTTTPDTTSPDSWPIEPPSSSHALMIKQSIRRRLKVYLKMCPPVGLRFCSSRDEYDALIAEESEVLFDRYSRYVDFTLQQWTPISMAEKQRLWHLETLRAYATLLKEQEALNKRLTRANEINEQSKAVIQRLKATQFPAAWQTGSMPSNHAPEMTAPLAEELLDLEPNPHEWDFQTIMNRYRTVDAPTSQQFPWPQAANDVHRYGQDGQPTLASRQNIGGEEATLAGATVPKFVQGPAAPLMREPRNTQDIEMRDDNLVAQSNGIG